MKEQKEKNPCTISGCKGNCCKNIFLELTIFERKRIFPKAIRVKSLKELKKVPREGNNIYYTSVRRKKFDCGGIVEAVIIGKCPHLDEDGNCKIHSERSHAARNFQIGSELCNEIRVSCGLPVMVPKEPVE